MLPEGLEAALGVFLYLLTCDKAEVYALTLFGKQGRSQSVIFKTFTKEYQP